MTLPRYVTNGDESRVQQSTNSFVIHRRPMVLQEFAGLLSEKPKAVIDYLIKYEGVLASTTQELNASMCIKVAEGFGKVVKVQETE